ncbi:MAG: nucleotide exchange factor GrpE [Haloechinothrix sp.]
MSAELDRDNHHAESENPDDCPTGQIAAQVIAEADRGSAGGTAHTDLDRLTADRQTLIRLCLYALDRARSGGIAERIEAGLATVGVTAMRPDGQRFDPALHEAGGAIRTDDATLDGVVAETELVGFLEGDRMLRAPIVTVYSTRHGARQ